MFAFKDIEKALLALTTIRPIPSKAEDVPKVAGKVVLVEVREVDFSVRYKREPVSPFIRAKFVPAVSVPEVNF